MKTYLYLATTFSMVTSPRDGQFGDSLVGCSGSCSCGVSLRKSLTRDNDPKDDSSKVQFLINPIAVELKEIKDTKLSPTVELDTANSVNRVTPKRINATHKVIKSVTSPSHLSIAYM